MREITQKETDEILDIVAIDSFEKALEIRKNKPKLEKYLSKKMRYYLYTVDCRTNGIFAISSQSWEKENEK